MRGDAATAEGSRKGVGRPLLRLLRGTKVSTIKMEYRHLLLRRVGCGEMLEDAHRAGRKGSLKTETC